MVVYSTDGLREDMIRPLISPDSIAVVGATGSAGKLGNMLMRSLLEFGFSGRIMPVNPRSDSVMGLRCFPDVRSAAAAAGSPPDSVYITVPPSKVLGCILDSVSAGAKSITVVASSIEFGGQGMPADTGELVGILHKSGTLLLGPNCLGIHNPLARVTFNQSLSSDAGNVVFLSQSGSMTEIFLLSMAARGIGTALAVSTGNEAMLTVSDFMLTAASMPGVNTVAAYVEEIRDPEKFIRACRALGPGRRVVVYKAGMTRKGREAASSHTGALAGDEETYRALFNKCNAIFASSYDEMVDITAAAAGRTPSGRKVAVISAPGGLCVSLSDALDRAGMSSPSFGQGLAHALSAILPRGIVARNPLDLTMAATSDISLYSRCIEAVDSSGEFDVIAVGAPTSYSTEEFVSAMGDVSERCSTPLSVVWMGETEKVSRGIAELCGLGIPTFRSPEAAARSLSALVRNRERSTRMGEVPEAATSDSRVLNVGAWMPPDEIRGLLESAGIGNYDNLPVADAEAAATVAAEVGYPVVLKISSPSLVHKSEAGGVMLGIRDEHELRLSFNSLIHHALSDLGLPDASITLSRQAGRGVELAVGAYRTSGLALLMLSPGGVLVELAGRKSFSVCPIGRFEAREMVEESGLLPFIHGFRGLQFDLEPLADLLVRLSETIARDDRILEMDINPLIAARGALWPADVRVRVRTA